MKTFSIITACYNSKEYIGDCIQSIIKNNYPLDKIEHIIIDDGSTDDSIKICKQYARKYPHIKFFSKTNGNWGSVINYVKNKKLVKNDYVIVCDSDDVLLPNAFKIINKKIKDADVLAASFYRWNKHTGRKVYITPYITIWPFYTRLVNNQTTKYYTPFMCPQSCIFKKEIFYKLPNLKEKLAYQDTILYYNIIKLSNIIMVTKKPICLYWVTRENNTMKNFKKQIKYLLMIVQNLRYFEQKNWIDPFVVNLMGSKRLRDYLKKNNLTFNFKGKLHLKYLPIITRPIFRLLYLIMIKKFIKCKKIFNYK